MADEKQLITFSGNPSSGDFLLGFRGVWTDPPIPIITNAVTMAQTMTDELCALPTVGVGNLVVLKQSNAAYDVFFQGALASQSVPLLDVDYAGINRGSIAVTETTAGAPPPPPEPDCPHILAIVSMSEPDQKGRRWAHNKCQLCGAEIDILTLSTDPQLADAYAASEQLTGTAPVIPPEAP